MGIAGAGRDAAKASALACWYAADALAPPSAYSGGTESSVRLILGGSDAESQVDLVRNEPNVGVDAGFMSQSRSTTVR